MSTSERPDAAAEPGVDPLPDGRRLPHPDRLPVDAPHRDEVLARHEAALAAAAPVYRDPASGYTVFTAAYLWNRGHCCDNACRHCPYAPR